MQVNSIACSCVLYSYRVKGRIEPGGVVCPVILASDKTTLTAFTGDKVTYPVYLTIGNISKSIRRKLSLLISVPLL